MPTITLEFPASVFSTLQKSPEEFAKEVRVAAAVQWFAEGLLSQSRGAEIAGISRAEFIDECWRRKVPVCQQTAEEMLEDAGSAADTRR
ncbi:MAG: UPF0175 family protein [Acidobacteria bacterium]|nr:UPF0175 family protein [Acidobacteriota bacterium]